MIRLPLTEAAIAHAKGRQRVRGSADHEAKAARAAATLGALGEGLEDPRYGFDRKALRLKLKEFLHE